MPGTIKAVIGKPKSGDSTSTKVQTLIFPKSGWEKSEVTGWLKSHDKKSGIDETEDSYRHGRKILTDSSQIASAR